MKLAIITNYWKNSDGGGIKTYVTTLVNELTARSDIHVDVIFKYGKDHENYHVSGNKLFFSIKSFWILIKTKPEIINSQSTWYTLLPGYLYRSILGGKLIHTFRSEPSFSTNIIDLLESKIMNILLSKCDYITFVSKGLEEVVAKKYFFDKKKSVITYPGVKGKRVTKTDISAFYENYGINNNSIVLLVQAFTANEIKCHGTKKVIDAVSILRSKYPELVLLLTRNGIYSNHLYEYALNKNIEKNIIFTGDIENQYIPLSICDIFLFPWIGESGVGNSLLEAMHSSKPIIATKSKIGGVSEILTNDVDSILVEPEPKLIAEKIDYLIQNPKIAEKLSKNAKYKADNDFTWNNTTKIFMEIYMK